MKKCKYLSGKDFDPDYLQLLTKSTDNMLENSKWAFINLQMLANNKKDLVSWLNANKENLCDVAIWNKIHGTPVMPERVMNAAFEFVFILSKDNNSRAIGTRSFRGNVSNVYTGQPQRKNEFAEIHSATFPVDFAAHFISTFTNQGDLILDLFGGTGTTMIAAEQLGRKCYMMELDPKYVDVIIQRWEEFTGQKSHKLQ